MRVEKREGETAGEKNSTFLDNSHTHTLSSYCIA